MGKPPMWEGGEVAIKCNLCHDRLRQDTERGPACSKACPTGALFWGKREEATAEAEARFALLQETFGQEIGGRRYMIYGKDDDASLRGLGVFAILEEESSEKYLRLPSSPRISSSVASWKGFFQWSAGIVPGAIVVLLFLHYLIFGPLGVQVVEEEMEKTYDEMTPEERAEFDKRMEKEIKMKRSAGKAKRLYQPAPKFKGRVRGKGARPLRKRPR
jgi:formate dehydrogenase iron-sulfur subunit